MHADVDVSVKKKSYLCGSCVHLLHEEDTGAGTPSAVVTYYPISFHVYNCLRMSYWSVYKFSIDALTECGGSNEYLLHFFLVLIQTRNALGACLIMKVLKCLRALVSISSSQILVNAVHQHDPGKQTSIVYYLGEGFITLYALIPF